MKKIIKKAVALTCAVAMLATSLNAWNQMQAVEASETEQTETTTVTPVELEGFKTVTTSDFVKADGTTAMADTAQYGKSVSGATNNYFQLNGADNLDQKLLTFKVKFQSTGKNNRIMFGAPDSDTAAAFYLYPLNTEELILERGNDKIVTTSPFTRIYVAQVENAGMTSTINQEFVLQIAIEYTDSNGDETDDAVNLNIYLNGQIALKDKEITAISDITQVGKWINVYCDTTQEGIQPVTVSIAGKTASETPEEPEEIKPVTMEGFRTITTKNFVDANGNVMGDQTFRASSNLYSLVDDEGNPIDSYDHTLLTMKLNFGTSQANSYARIEFAGKDTDTGFRFFAQNDTKFAFNNRATSDDNKVVPTNPYTSFDVTSAVNKDVLVQISMEYGNFDDDNTVDDIKMNFYFDGTLREEKTFTDCKMENLGNCFRVYINSTTDNPQGPITLSAPAQEEETTTNNLVTLDGFKTITTSNFVDSNNNKMSNSQAYTQSSSLYSLVDDAGNAISNFDKILLSLKVKFGSVGSSANHEIRFCGKDANDYVRVFALNAQTLVFNRGGNNKLVTTDNAFTRIPVTSYGISDVTTEEFNLQISIECTSTSSIKFGFYLNGHPAGEKEVLTCDLNYFGNCLQIRCTSGALSVSSIIEQKFVTLPGFKTITTNNFESAGIKMGDGTHETQSDVFYYVDEDGNKIENLDKTLLSMKVKFGSTTYQNNHIRFCGKDGSDYLKLFVNTNNQLVFNRSGESSNMVTDGNAVYSTIQLTEYGMTSAIGEEFLLQISIQYVDQNNVTFGFYINGKHAMTKQVKTSCNTDYFGSGLQVYVNKSGGGQPISVASTPCMYGDTNPNGATDIRDLVAIVKASEGLALKHTTGSVGADVSKNGRIDLYDILEICKNLLQRQ